MANINTKTINIKDLIPHPMQSKTYNEQIPAEFIESIRTHGITVTPIVAPAWSVGIKGDPNQFVIISGHRRIQATKMIYGDDQIVEILCEVRDYKTQAAADLDFIISNQHREKSEIEKAQEFIRYKKGLNDVGKYLKNQALNNKPFDEDLSVWTIVQNVGLDPENPNFDAREIARERIGLSQYEAKILTVIYDDDYHDKKQGKLIEKGLNLDDLQEIRDGISAAVEELESGSLTLNAAKDAINGIYKEFEAKFAPKKAKGSAKAQTKKQKPKTSPPVQFSRQQIINLFSPFEKDKKDVLQLQTELFRLDDVQVFSAENLKDNEKILLFVDQLKSYKANAESLITFFKYSTNYRSQLEAANE